MLEIESLTAYLATRDAPCPGCFKNIRGHTEPRCQACGRVLHLGEVLTAHAAFGDAKGAPVITPPQAQPITLKEYLTTHDAPCPSCAYNLRGLTDRTCPECGHTIYLYDFLPERPKPEDVFLPLYPWFAAIAVPVIAIGFLPVLVDACRVIWERGILNSKAGIPVSLALACTAAVGVVYTIRHSSESKKRSRVRTRAALERAQNIRIALVLALFAVAVVLICRMTLGAIGRVLGGGGW